MVRRERASCRRAITGTTSGSTTLIRPLAVAGIEPYASRLKAAPDELISIFTPDDIKIVVTGGETQAAFKMFGGHCMRAGPGNFARRQPRSTLIDEWR